MRLQAAAWLVIPFAVIAADLPLVDERQPQGREFRAPMASRLPTRAFAGFVRRHLRGRR